MTPYAAGDQPPKAIFWFKLYCGLLCALYLAVAAFSLVFFLGDFNEAEMPRSLRYSAGALLLGGGLFFFGACLPPLLRPPRPWLWVYNLIVICLGMTSPCFLPICLPLLIFWLKPDVRRYFGRA